MKGRRVPHHELLQVGAVSTTGVVASLAYINEAAEEARMQGRADRVGYQR